jgi:tetratricopeptide (TPR) repeat protein
MPSTAYKIKASAWTRMGLLLWALFLFGNLGRAGDYSFTNSMEQATAAEKQKDVSAALKIYDTAAQAESNHVASLCVLARRYCDLMYLTNSAPMQKDLAERALACSLRAVEVDSNNSTAHACVAVCYAKNSAFADIKTQVSYSRQIKIEAEKAVALDPKQDIGYYLLGRWNYGVANMGLLSRTFVKVVYGGLPKASNEEAIANYKKAIQLAPERAMHHAALAMVYETVGKEQLEILELKECGKLKPTGLEDEDAQRDALKKLAALGR